ncbi:MFS transporter [Seohaeicola saemankumensis]|nr:MFS transporter [Seohaeicola saemankumensis]MCA0871072.1 MFS transporter [Seohaeicola saemankumensis]
MYARAGLFAFMLAAAGLPLYIHLPRYAVTELGLSLSMLGAILIGIRVMDFAQDPLLGRLVDRFPRFRTGFAGLACAAMGLGFLALFSVSPLLRPDLWLVLTLVVLFTGYSLGAILFYSQSTAIAPDAQALIRLAGFRETGTLVGVVLAALVPVILLQLAGPAAQYAGFGVLLALVCAGTFWVTRPLWRPDPPEGAALSLAGLMSSGGGQLLLLALVNSLPVAMTSTLFLFFVEDRLMLPGQAGGFLILFFIAAGVSVPLWTRLSDRFGVRAVLLPAMVLAVASFVWAAMLGPGAAVPFALVCIGSGAALGADMVILPVVFSATLRRAGLPAGQAFGLWFLAGKLALAVAAVVLLPALEVSGFTPGSLNDREALMSLSFAYAVVPCVLKLIAIALVFRLPREVLAL